MANPVSNHFDWSAIYADVQAGTQVPATSETTRDGSTLIFRDLLVSLDTVIQTVETAPTRPLFVHVFADVVTLSAERNWALPPIALFIVARRVVAASGTFLQLDYRKETQATLVLYAGEIEGPLRVQAVTAAQPNTPRVFDLTTFPSLGVRIAFAGGQAVQTPLTALPDELLSLGSPLWMSLSTNFEVGSILAESRSEAARAMLGWIQAACAPSPKLREIGLQSAALLAQLTVSASGVTFVPYLSPSVYRDSATAFGEAVKQYENEYQRFSAATASKEQWIASAQNMQKYFALTNDFNRELVAQATGNLKGAQDAVAEAKQRFTLVQLTIAPLRERFKAGIEIWKSDQKLAAVFSILSAVATFGASIAAMAIGDEAAAAGAAGAVTNAAKAADQAAKVGGEVSKLSGTMSALVEAMKALQKITEALTKTYEFIQKIVEASSRIQDSSAYGNPVPSVDDISAQAEWDIFRMKVDRMMQFPVDQSIEGASEYREALDQLAIYGKALAATQASLVRTAQELARLQLQSRVSSGMTETIDASIERMKASEKPDQLMMHLLFVRGLNIKRWLFIAIRNYTWSFRYWALRPSSVKASITASASELVEEFATMQRDYAEALQSFNPPPQKFGWSEGGVAVDITDPRVLQDLRTKGEAQFTVDAAAPAFAAYDRVRLSRLRVWLHGASGPAYVQIRTNGVYRDRLRGEAFTFTAAPLERFFQYHGAPGDELGIDGDGDVADEQRFAYFQPTPFTVWHIKVPKSLNPKIDLAGLDKISMTFSGSAIGDMRARL